MEPTLGGGSDKILVSLGHDGTDTILDEMEPSLAVSKIEVSQHSIASKFLSYLGGPRCQRSGATIDR